MTGGSGVPTAVARLFDDRTVAWLIALRRAIHQDPELSGAETRTAGRLAAALGELPGVEVRRVAGTGVVARVRGRRGSDAPVAAVRGDIDALPIHEDTGLEYASRNAGVMHACGHDVHATWAVGAAALLAANPSDGDAVIVLQPSEETGTGATAMIDAGALDGVSAIVGGHVDRRFAVGEVVVDEGPLAASADTFTITLTGAGAHAARPHESADVVVAAAAALVTAIQTIVARRLDPSRPGVVTVGMLSAGTAPNVIPDRATLRGTIRAVEPTSRAIMHGALREIATGVAAAHGVGTTVELTLGTPPLVNPRWPTDLVRAAAVDLLGADRVVPFGTTNLAGEDFACYLDRIPGCFVRVGAREVGGVPIAAHSPRFHPAEESILMGAALLAESVRRITGASRAPR